MHTYHHCFLTVWLETVEFDKQKIYYHHHHIYSICHSLVHFVNLSHLVQLVKCVGLSQLVHCVVIEFDKQKICYHHNHMYSICHFAPQCYSLVHFVNLSRVKCVSLSQLVKCVDLSHLVNCVDFDMH